MSVPQPLTFLQRETLAAFVTAAENGAPCPSNAEIADILGSDESHMPTIVKGLVRRGLISIRTVTRSCRAVTIIATGKSTAQTSPRQIRRIIHSPYRELNPMPPEELSARIDADQARLRARREVHLIAEQQRYRLPRRGRMIEEMAL